jgi:hypothetical protein
VFGYAAGNGTPLIEQVGPRNRYPGDGSAACDALHHGTFVVMTPAGTRLLGLVGLFITFGTGIWAWTSDLPLWWKTLMSAIGLPFLAVASQYLLLGRYPTIVLDQVGITYPSVRGPHYPASAGTDRAASLGRSHQHRNRASSPWESLAHDPVRIGPDSARDGSGRWGTGERAPYIRISLSVLPVSEETLVEQLRVRALPHRFADERGHKPTHEPVLVAGSQSTRVLVGRDGPRPRDLASQPSRLDGRARLRGDVER